MFKKIALAAAATAVVASAMPAAAGSPAVSPAAVQDPYVIEGMDQTTNRKGLYLLAGLAAIVAVAAASNSK